MDRKSCQKRITHHFVFLLPSSRLAELCTVRSVPLHSFLVHCSHLSVLLCFSVNDLSCFLSYTLPAVFQCVRFVFLSFLYIACGVSVCTICLPFLYIACCVSVSVYNGPSSQTFCLESFPAHCPTKNPSNSPRHPSSSHCHNLLRHPSSSHCNNLLRHHSSSH